MTQGQLELWPPNFLLLIMELHSKKFFILCKFLVRCCIYNLDIILNLNLTKSIRLALSNLYLLGRSPYGVGANVLDCDIIICEFEFPYPSCYRLNSTSTELPIGWLWH